MVRTELSEKWIKASIIGTIWAASEIVLGSFLHNLRIPFSGNILTAIGLVILISIGHSWSERGIFWRAGLICAILKTMSPSAVIFGPMIAIFAESLLLEISVRILGRTIPGYLAGAMLAMSWNLFQKIANYIIFYGSNIVDVYVNLLNIARKQLNIQTDITWLPILLLLVVYALFGLFAGFIGIRVGQRMTGQKTDIALNINKKDSSGQSSTRRHEFAYSLVWFFADIILMIGSFFLLSFTQWYIWSPVITMIVIVWSLRYRMAFRRLSKPGFWILFVLITLLTAFVFTQAGSGENVLAKGFLTGIQMNFRAVLIITGFSVLGTELYNPVIRNFFLRTSAKTLPLALELSAESLPSFIASIPDLKSIIKNPVSIFHQIILHAEERLSEIKKKQGPERKTFIITGSVGEGKTTFIKTLIGLLRNEGVRSGGIYSQRILENGVTTGYDLVDAETGRKEIFLRRNGDSSMAKIGAYFIFPKGLEFGRRAIRRAHRERKAIIVVDEAGKLELEGKGWAEALRELVADPATSLLVAVRDKYTDEVTEKFQLGKCFMFRVKEMTPESAARAILEELRH